MSNWKWTSVRAALNVPIFYKVIVANSAMAFVVISVLLLFHETKVVVAAVVIACGVINALLVRAAFAIDQRHRQQRELFRWTLNQTEAERDRVAGAIRDGAAQRLAALVLKTRSDQLVSNEAAQVMRELYETAQTLQPPRMQLLGLKGALDWYVGNVERLSGVDIRLEVYDDLAQLDAAGSLAVYRIIEDAVDTVTQHAPARVDILLSVTPRAVNTSIRAAASAGSAGVSPLTRADQFRLSERAACFGGQVHFTSRRDAAEIAFTVPIRVNHVRHN